MVYALYQWSSLLLYSAGWFATTIVVGSYHTLEPSPSIGHQFITSWCLCHRTPWISYCNQPPSSSMVYIIYTSLYVVDRPLLAVENRTMVLSQRQNSTSSWHKKSNIPYTTTSPIPPTNLPDRRNPMQQKGIYNIEWVLRWRFSAYHCEPNVQHARWHITNETERFFSWLHTTIILTPTIGGGRIAIHEKNIYHIEWALRKWLACYLWGPNMYRCTVSQM